MNTAQKESQDKIIRESNDMAAAERAKSMEVSPEEQSGKDLYNQVMAEQKFWNSWVEAQGEHMTAAQNRAAYVKSHRDYFESVSEGMTAQGIIDRGGVQFASTQTIEDGALGIVAAGGERKGSFQTIEGGAAGITAAGGRKTGPHLGIGASFREQFAAVKWGSGMQNLRTLARQYQARQKKKNDGGLTAARQRHTGKNFFGHRPMFTVGSVTYNPMTFNGYFPQVGTYRACEEGWPQMVNGSSDTLNRVTLQAGRNYRASQPLYNP